MSRDSKTYRIIKVFNNNVVLANDVSSNQELVIVGKGIGFGQKPGRTVELFSSKIEKMFIACENNSKKQFYKLIDQIDLEVMGASEEIIAMAQEKLGDLNPHVHIALTDHIGFAIDRLKMGMDVNNPFLDEIKLLYPEEYKIALKGAETIKNKLKVKLPSSEIGFIALHLHAARQNKNVSETVKYTSLISELVKMIEDRLGIKLDRTELSYIRLVNHLHFAIDRVVKNKTVKNPIINKIQEEFKDSFELAKNIAKHIKNRLNITVCEDEISYITIHIQRLKNIYN